MAHSVLVPELNITPGDWEVKHFPPEKGNHFFVAAPAYEGHPHGKRHTKLIDILSDEDYPAKLADAYLIAAAPDLYRVLEYILGGEKDHDLEADYSVEGASLIRAAIAKAQVPKDRMDEWKRAQEERDGDLD